jgi:hypothetical protein
LVQAVAAVPEHPTLVLVSELVDVAAVVVLTSMSASALLTLLPSRT